MFFNGARAYLERKFSTLSWLLNLSRQRRVCLPRATFPYFPTIRPGSSTTLKLNDAHSYLERQFPHLPTSLDFFQAGRRVCLPRTSFCCLLASTTWTAWVRTNTYHPVFTTFLGSSTLSAPLKAWREAGWPPPARRCLASSYLTAWAARKQKLPWTHDFPSVCLQPEQKSSQWREKFDGPLA